MEYAAQMPVINYEDNLPFMNMNNVQCEGLCVQTSAFLIMGRPQYIRVLVEIPSCCINLTLC